MNHSLEHFQKQHNYLICIDSDGCVMDNLEVKHLKCFGPCLIREWKLEPLAEAVMALWAEINLYSLTRGINRFRALAMALETVDRDLKRIPGLPDLTAWLDNTEDFTAEALAREAERTRSEILQKALRWSEETNKAIAEIAPEDCRVFSGVREALAFAGRFADIAVVSGANRDAVLSEWTSSGLAGSVDLFLCQEAGSKARCIAQLKKKGYGENCIMMVGDAPIDRASAELNGVFFYPILVRREPECWADFPRYAAKFLDGVYQDEQSSLSEAFIINLAGGHIHD